MRIWLKSNILYIALILIGVISSLVIISGRLQVEQHSTYDVVIDYDSMKKMVAESGEDIPYWLNHFSSLGIARIAVTETSLNTLEEDTGYVFRVRSAPAATSTFGWEDTYPADVVSALKNSRLTSDLLVSTSEASAMDWLYDCITERLPSISVQRFAGDSYYFLWIPTRNLADSKLADVPLGIWPDTASMILSAGCSIIPRVSPVTRFNDTDFTASFLSDLDRYQSPYFINAGTDLVGFDSDEASELLASYIREHDIATGLIEKSDQSLVLTWDGLDDLLTRTDYKAVRVFSMWDYIQTSYAKYNYSGPEEITNALYRAAYERGCSVLYVKMMMNESGKKYITDAEEYTKLFSDLDSRMQARGYTLGTVSPLSYYAPRARWRILIGFSVVAAAVLLLSFFCVLPQKLGILLLGLGCVGVVGAAFVLPNTYRILLSISGGIVFAALSLCGLNYYYAVRRFSSGIPTRGIIRIIYSCLGAVLFCYAVSYIGGMFASSALVDSAYLLETKLYRGVKVMQLIPIAITLISFLQLFIWERLLCPELLPPCPLDFSQRASVRSAGWNTFTNRSVRVVHVIWLVVGLVCVGILLAVGIYYISRTGNATNGISDAELLFRNFLEKRLAARPRTKEFLIGTPCIFLLIWSLHRGLSYFPLIFDVGAAIGMTSVVNTFLHIRSSYSLSTIRVLIGLCLGIVIGIITVLIAEGIYCLVKNRIVPQQTISS